MTTEARLRRESAERMACSPYSTEALEAGAIVALVAAAEAVLTRIEEGLALGRLDVEPLRAALAKFEEVTP